jgi:hypothetical protein
MRMSGSLVLLSLSLAAIATPQGRPVDWPSFGGDARRTGWEKSDVRITKDNVKDFRLVLKRKLENPQGGVRALTPPVVIGLLISYKGFKELGFIAGSSGNVWSLDLDLNKVFWQQHFAPGTDKSALCGGSVTAMPALVPPAVFGGRRPAAPPAARPAPSQSARAAANAGGPQHGAPGRCRSTSSQNWWRRVRRNASSLCCVW